MAAATTTIAAAAAAATAVAVAVAIQVFTAAAPLLRRAAASRISSEYAGKRLRMRKSGNDD